jgi:hypothetical protein
MRAESRRDYNSGQDMEPPAAIESRTAQTKVLAGKKNGA